MRRRTGGKIELRGCPVLSCQYEKLCNANGCSNDDGRVLNIRDSAINQEKLPSYGIPCLHSPKQTGPLHFLLIFNGKKKLFFSAKIPGESSNQIRRLCLHHYTVGGINTTTKWWKATFTQVTWHLINGVRVTDEQEEQMNKTDGRKLIRVTPFHRVMTHWETRGMKWFIQLMSDLVCVGVWERGGGGDIPALETHFMFIFSKDMTPFKCQRESRYISWSF